MNMAAFDTNADIDPALLLGFLEFHTIPDLKISKADLLGLFVKHKVPQHHLPAEIKEHDAFRRASATLQQSISVDNAITSKARLLVREVLSDEDSIVRVLVRELVDSKNKVLEYDSIASITFNRASCTVSVNCNSYFLNEFAYDELLTEMKELYYEWTNFHTKDTVRNILNKIVNDMNPISFSPRSKASFIPRQYSEELRGVAEMVHALTRYCDGYAECEMIMLPLIDSNEQRSLIDKKLKDEISFTTDNLIVELSEVLATQKTLQIRTLQRYAGEITTLRQKVRDYQKLLGTKMDLLDGQLDEALSRLDKISGP